MTDNCFATQLIEDIGIDGMRMLVGVFSGDLDRLLAALNAAAIRGDAMAFHRAAHGLAGAAGAIGADTLERACRTAMERVEEAHGALDSLLPDIVTNGEAARRDLAAMLVTLDVGS